MKNPLQELEEIKRLLKLDGRSDWPHENTAHIFAILGNYSAILGNYSRNYSPDEQLVETAVNMVKRWIIRLHQHGVTEGLAKDLNAYLKNVPTEARLEFDPHTKKVDLVFGQVDFDARRPIEVFAYIFCKLLERGHFKNLKRCAAEDCGKFHVRRGKWCDDGCGSRERQRVKRRRDKERQML